MNKITFFCSLRKVSMLEIVSHGQSRAAKKAVRPAAIESIKDQNEMSKRARLLKQS